MSYHRLSLEMLSCTIALLLGIDAQRWASVRLVETLPAGLPFGFEPADGDWWAVLKGRSTATTANPGGDCGAPLASRARSPGVDGWPCWSATTTAAASSSRVRDTRCWMRRMREHAIRTGR